MTQTVTDLGEVGVAGEGILRPFALTVQRGGATWNLSAYTSPTIQVWDLATRTAVTAGSVAIADAANGVVNWTPNAAVYAASGVYEGRIYAVPSGGGDPEPSGLFRFSIAAGANP